MARSKFKELVLDLGGVLLLYSADNITALSPFMVKHILKSNIWCDYEKGKLTQQQCFLDITKEFALAPGAWEKAFSQLESSLKPNVEMINAIKDLKTVFPSLRVHGLSNISTTDFEKLQVMVDEWSILDSMTTSASIGSRKPEFKVYDKLQEALKIEAQATIFVDDQPENVVTAHSLGFHGLLFEETGHLTAQLHNLLGDPVSRGMGYLRCHAKKLWCETSSGEILKDNYSQLMILQCIGDRGMVSLKNEGDTWQFFMEERLFTDDAFPTDTDTTSLAMVTLNTSMNQKERVMELMLSHQSPDGLPLVYFDRMRPRFCPIVAANVLRFFFLNGQGNKMQTTLQYLCRVLKSNAFEINSRYYCQADWIFYYLSDLCEKCFEPALNELRTLLVVKLQQRMGCDKDVLGAAMRLLAAQALKLANTSDLATLLQAQQLDGGWEFGWLWRYKTFPVKIGSRFVPTSMAIKGIQAALKA